MSSMKHMSDLLHGYRGIIDRRLPCFRNHLSLAGVLLLASIAGGLSLTGLMMRSRDAAMRRELL